MWSSFFSKKWEVEEKQNDDIFNGEHCCLMSSLVTVISVLVRSYPVAQP